MESQKSNRNVDCVYYSNQNTVARNLSLILKPK